LISNLYIDLDLVKYILPYGIPRNSYVVLAGEGGSGKSLLVTNIAKTLLEKGEPVVYISFDDDPLTIVNQFKSLSVDVLEYSGKGLFYIIDGYTYMMRGKTGKLHEVVVEEIDPHDIDQAIDVIIRFLNEGGIRDRGIVIIDSLNEFLNYHDVSRVLEFVKLSRANISKLRNILAFTILHTTTDYYMEFLHSIEHLVDGIIFTETVVEHPMAEQVPLPLRRILVKKMKGVGHKVTWTFYIIDREGIKPVRIIREESSPSEREG